MGLIWQILKVLIDLSNVGSSLAGVCEAVMNLDCFLVAFPDMRECQRNILYRLRNGLR